MRNRLQIGEVLSMQPLNNSSTVWRKVPANKGHTAARRMCSACSGCHGCRTVQQVAVGTTIIDGGAWRATLQETVGCACHVTSACHSRFRVSSVVFFLRHTPRPKDFGGMSQIPTIFSVPWA